MVVVLVTGVVFVDVFCVVGVVIFFFLCDDCVVVKDLRDNRMLVEGAGW